MKQNEKIGDIINQLAIFDEHTRHEEMTIFCVMTSSASDKIKK